MSGLASWFGKVPSTSKHSVVTLQGSCSNSRGATIPAMPLPASSTTLNGLMIDGSMNDMTCFDVVVDTSSCVRLPGVAASGGSVPDGDHVADVADARLRR